MSSHSSVENISALINQHLTADRRHSLAETAKAAAQRGAKAYLVGGAVRDLILGSGSRDLDIVVEGDAREVAEALVHLIGGKAQVHNQFLTATVVKHGLRIDLTSAREETYAHPGALPKIRLASLLTDLRRRDFTLNAMATTLDPNHFGDIIDPVGGRADLDACLIRVLHDNSFADDATRSLRACRYATRFGFNLESETRRLIRRDAHFLDSVSGDRIRREIERTLEGNGASKAFSLAQDLGLLEAIHPDFHLSGNVSRALSEATTDDPTIGLAVLASGLAKETAASLAIRLAVPGEIRRAMLDASSLTERLSGLSLRSIRNSELHKILSRYSPKAIRACRLTTDSPIMRSRIADFAEVLSGAKSLLSGADLVSLGVDPGPEIGLVLETLLQARLDGKIKSRDDELKAVRKWLEHFRGK